MVLRIWTSEKFSKVESSETSCKRVRHEKLVVLLVSPIINWENASEFEKFENKELGRYSLMQLKKEIQWT